VAVTGGGTAGGALPTPGNLKAVWQEFQVLIKKSAPQTNSKSQFSVAIFRGT